MIIDNLIEVSQMQDLLYVPSQQYTFGEILD